MFFFYTIVHDIHLYMSHLLDFLKNKKSSHVEILCYNADMNIFFLHSNPETCAQMHNDKHTVKMAIEYAQLMSTAHRVLDGEERIVYNEVPNTYPVKYRKKTIWMMVDVAADNELYKATHINHPSAIWTRMSRENYEWLFLMWQYLLEEYTHRYGKVHACSKLTDRLSVAPMNIKDAPFTDPLVAMPDEYVVDSVVESYRNYYNKAKADFSTWKNRNTPEWFKHG
jgi:hypothetical protein